MHSFNNTHLLLLLFTSVALYLQITLARTETVDDTDSRVVWVKQSGLTTVEHDNLGNDVDDFLNWSFDNTISRTWDDNGGFSFSFEGKSVAIISVLHGSLATMQIFIDGSLVDSVTLKGHQTGFNPTVWSSPELSEPGLHTLKVIHAPDGSGLELNMDALVVTQSDPITSLPPLPPQLTTTSSSFQFSSSTTTTSSSTTSSTSSTSSSSSSTTAASSKQSSNHNLSSIPSNPSSSSDSSTQSDDGHSQSDLRTFTTTTTIAPSTQAHPSGSGTLTSSHGKLSPGFIAAIAASAFVLLLLLFGIVPFLRWRKRRLRAKKTPRVESYWGPPLDSETSLTSSHSRSSRANLLTIRPITGLSPGLNYDVTNEKGGRYTFDGRTNRMDVFDLEAGGRAERRGGDDDNVSDSNYGELELEVGLAITDDDTRTVAPTEFSTDPPPTYKQ